MLCEQKAYLAVQGKKNWAAKMIHTLCVIVITEFRRVLCFFIMEFWIMKRIGAQTSVHFEDNDEPADCWLAMYFVDTLGKRSFFAVILVNSLL